VTLNAADPAVSQPGSYTAGLVVENDTQYRVPDVAVTMNVTPPKTLVIGTSLPLIAGGVGGRSRCPGARAAARQLGGWRGSGAPPGESGDEPVEVSVIGARNTPLVGAVGAVDVVGGAA
jgi:hypothetical protein